MKNKISKIVNVILYVVLGVILISNLFILFQAKTNDDKVPAIFGYKPFIVMSGSMESEIYTNDLIFVKTIEPSNLKLNDIIAFRTSDNVIVTHRIIGVTKSGNNIYFTTKGDNNDNEDNEIIEGSKVEGKYVSRIPKLGKWFLFIGTSTGMLVSLLIAVVMILIYAFVNMSLDKKVIEKEDEQYRKEFEEFKKNNPHKD